MHCLMVFTSVYNYAMVISMNCQLLRPRNVILLACVIQKQLVNCCNDLSVSIFFRLNFMFINIFFNLLYNFHILLELLNSFVYVLSSRVCILQIMRDPDTGNSKGYAFINFASFEAADSAIEAMNGQYLCNRAITISYAFRKDAKGERHGSAAG